MGDIAGVVYMITCLGNNEFYIGSSIDYKSRKRSHISDLKLNKHHSKYLQKSFNKYGLPSLEFSIIEVITNENIILKRESFYIKKMKPKFNSGYVCATRKGSKHTKESIEKMRQSKKGVKVSEEYKRVLSERFKGNKIQVGNTNKRKVTPEILKKVQELRSLGFGCRKIAKEVKLNKTTILNIFNKKFNYG